MIKHIVFWRLAAEALGAAKAENAVALKEMAEALADSVPGVRHLEVGFGFVGDPQAWDVALYSEFDSREDLAAYQAHPEHLKVAEFVAAVKTDRAVVDYEV